MLPGTILMEFMEQPSIFFLELVMLEIYVQSKKKSRGIPHHRISIQMYNYNMMHLIFSQWPTLHAGTFAVLDLGYW